MIHHQHLVYLQIVRQVLCLHRPIYFWVVAELISEMIHIFNCLYLLFLPTPCLPHTHTHTHKYKHRRPQCFHIGYLKTCIAFENMNIWKKQKCWHKCRKHPGEQTKGGVLGKFNLPIISLSPQWSEYFSFIFVQANMLQCLPFQQSEIH